MADVQECITKLVATGAISRAIGDEALDMFKSSRAEYSRKMGPASADAAAALQAAKMLRDKAASRQIAIASDVKALHVGSERVLEDPRGYKAAMAGILAKDTLRGDNRLNALRRANPEHPIITGPNIDELGKTITDSLYSQLGPETEKFMPRLAGRAAVIRRSSNFVDELFHVDSGDPVAKAFAGGWEKVTKDGEQQAISAGKEFEPNEHWRLPQPEFSDRVQRFTEQEYVDRFTKWMDAGGVKLWDKDTNKYAKADRYDYILRRAYSDIKNDGGSTAPFNKEMRTFEFQDGAVGAAAWKDIQKTFGTGDEIMGSAMAHLERMGRTIALHRVLGSHPDAMFEALMRLGKDKNDAAKDLPYGLRWAQKDNTLRLTYNVLSGKGFPAADEALARRMAGVRAMLGAASLRNLSIRIMPSDAAMTLMTTTHNGMSFVDVMRHLFDGKMTKQAAQHLQISSASTRDFMLNSWRRYEDQVNVSGLGKRMQSAVVNATGARWWTDNGRLGFKMSVPHLLAEMRSQPWDKLPENLRSGFLGPYGFTPADWDKIRSVAPRVEVNGAEYLDYPNIEKSLSERLRMATSEQSAYAFHQPDARTTAIAQGNAPPGTATGELWRSVMQYKQFGMERLTTHVMRILYDGTAGARLNRAFAFVALSFLAGAVSNQAEKVISGRKPDDMTDPKFWIRAGAAGGVGGIYGDVLGEALLGDRGVSDLVAQLAGPLPGLAGDVTKTAIAPLRRELLDEHGNRVTSSAAGELFATAKRWTPETWYTKLPVDRLFWEQLQQLFDPHYRDSFKRANQAAKRSPGQGYWFAPGAAEPDFMR